MFNGYTNSIYVFGEYTNKKLSDFNFQVFPTPPMDNPIESDDLTLTNKSQHSFLSSVITRWGSWLVSVRFVMIEYCVLVYWCVLGVLCLVEVYFIHVGPGCTFGVLVAVYCVLVAGYSVLAVLCCVLLGKSCGFGGIIWGQGMAAALKLHSRSS